MATVSEQLKKRRVPASPADKRPTAPSPKPATPVQPDPEPELEETDESDSISGDESTTTKKRGRPRVELSEEEKQLKLAAKEARKQEAFAKLRDLNAAKKLERRGLLAEKTRQVASALKPGDIRFSTRASYYGVKCRVEEVEEVRGKILVTVTCLTTKTGHELAEDAQYTRRFSPEFLVEEYPTEPYVPRRGGKVKGNKGTSKRAEKRHAAKAEAKKARATAGLDNDDTVEVIEDEVDEDLEAQVEETEDPAEDSDVDFDETEEDDEEEEDEEDSDTTDEAEEDSWA